MLLREHHCIGILFGICILRLIRILSLHSGYFLSEYFPFYYYFLFRHKQYHSPNALFSSLMNTNILAHKTTGSPQVHKQYHSPNALFSSLMNTNILAHKTTGSPQVHTPQRSPDSTTDTNIAYVTYPTTYLQVPIPLEQTTDSISSSHSSQQSNSSPHTLAYALPAQFQNTFGYHSS